MGNGIQPNPEIDILLVTHNHWGLTELCLEALYAYTKVPFRLTVLDDSTDCTPGELERIAREKGNVQIIRPEMQVRNINQLWNIGVSRTDCQFIALMVNSIIVEPEWLDAHLRLIKKYPDVGIVGFKLLNPSGTIQCTSVMGIRDDGLMAVAGMNEPAHHCTLVSEVPAVGGALMLVRRESWPKDGLDDTTYIGFRGWDDLDMCCEFRERGWTVLYCGYGSAYHRDSPTKKNGNMNLFWDEFNENRRRFLQRWDSSLRRLKDGVH